MKLTLNTGTGQTVAYDLTNNTVEYIAVSNGTMVKVTTYGCGKGEQQ